MATRVTTSGFNLVDKSLLDMGRKVDTSKRAALRSAAKVVAAVAQGDAPEYHGPRPDVPKGRLRKSIRPGKMTTKLGLTSVTVAAQYPGVLYAGKIDAETPYMQRARDVAEPALAEAVEIEMIRDIRL